MLSSNLYSRFEDERRGSLRYPCEQGRSEIDGNASSLLVLQEATGNKKKESLSGSLMGLLEEYIIGLFILSITCFNCVIP